MESEIKNLVLTGEKILELNLIYSSETCENLKKENEDLRESYKKLETKSNLKIKEKQEINNKIKTAVLKNKKSSVVT